MTQIKKCYNETYVVQVKCGSRNEAEKLARRLNRVSYWKTRASVQIRRLEETEPGSGQYHFILADLPVCDQCIYTEEAGVKSVAIPCEQHSPK